MIQMQLGGLFKEYCDYKSNQNFADKTFFSINQTNNFKTLQRDTLKEFDILRSINKDKLKNQKKSKYTGIIKLTEPEILDPLSQPENSLINVHSSQFDMVELQQIRARTISRQEESQRLNKNGGGRRATKIRHNGGLESIAEQQEFFGLGGESFYNVDNNNQPFQTLKMDEMDYIALDVEQDIIDTLEAKLEVVGTSKGIFKNQNITNKQEKTASNLGENFEEEIICIDKLLASESSEHSSVN